MYVLVTQESLTGHLGSHIDCCDSKALLLKEPLFCLIMSPGFKHMDARNLDIADKDNSMLLLNEDIEVLNRESKKSNCKGRMC